MQSRPEKAHRRNKYVQVERVKDSAAPDASGHINLADNGNWQPHSNQWCGVVPRGSREFFRREQVASDITHAVEMLYSPETAQINDEFRILMDGRILAIAEPPRNVDEQNHTLVFACIEKREGK